MAKCINCGGELFETSRFCPHCGTPVLEVSSNSDSTKIKEYESHADLEESVEGLPDINTAELTPEEQAAVLEMAAEKVLEDIPFIKKLDDISAETEKTEENDEIIPKKEEIHKEEVPEAESPNPSEETPPEKNDNVIVQTEAKQPEVKYETETVNIPPVPEKKKSKGGLIAVIAVIAAAAVGGAVFFMGQNKEPVIIVEQTETIPEMTAEISEDTAAEITEESSETDILSETDLSSDISSEMTSEVSVSEADSDILTEEADSETSLASESSEMSESEESEAADSEISTAGDLAAGIVIEPEHSAAMGNGISAEISLSAEGIDRAVLTDGVLFLAEYTSQASAPDNITPAAMVIRIGDTSVDVSAASSSEGIVIFEYEAMRAAVEEAGFTADDIDSVAIRSTGVPIDVFKITIFQG